MAVLYLESDGLHLGSSVGNSSATPHLWTPANGVNTTTSYVWSSVAVTLPITETIDAIVLLGRRLTSTGTVSIAISNNGGSTVLQENAYPVTAMTAGGTGLAHVFLLSSSITGDGGTNWKVGIKSSSAGNAAFDRVNTTAGNWFFTFRRTTTASASSGDNFMLVPGIAPTTGTIASVTHTWSDTANTSYAGMVIGYNGTLQVPTTASTAYTMKMSHHIVVNPGGVFKVGVSAGDPIPSTSSFELTFVNSVNVDFGFYVRGSVYMYGTEKSSWHLLAADAAANATSLTLDTTPTGWKDNDEIALGPTGRTATHNELGAINGTVSSATISVDGFAGTGGGIVNARDGSAANKRQAEVLNLTRNIRFHGTSATLGSFFTALSGYVIDVVFQYVEFFYIGSNTTDKRGIELRSTTTGTIEVKGCSFHRGTVNGACGLLLWATAAYATANIYDNCAYLFSIHGFYIENVTANTSWACDRLAAVSGNNNATLAAIRFLKATPMTNIRSSASLGYGIDVESTSNISASSSEVHAHSNAKDGLRITPDISSASSWTTEWDFSGFYSWRNNVGFNFTYATARTIPMIWKNFYSIGNTLGGLRWSSSFPYLKVINSQLKGETNYSSAYHVYILNAFHMYLEFNNIDFGTITPIGTGTLEASDIVIAGNAQVGRLHCKNCIHSTKYVVGVDTATPPGAGSQFYWDGDDGTYHGFMEGQLRRIEYDTFTYNQDFVSSYENIGGKGSRGSIITATSAASTFGTGTAPNIIDGASTNNLYLTNGGAASGKWIKFDFGASYSPIITEATWRQSATTSLGTWQWEGSNDDTNWTVIGSSFTLGGATVQVQTSLSGNTTAYRYYRLAGQSGTMSHAPWIYELEFKLYYAPVSANGVVTPPTQKLKPLNANAKAESSPILVFLTSGESKSFTIKIRKIDGRTEGSLAYAGAEPRIILKKNDQMGVTSDTVVDTMAEAVGIWETFTVNTPAVTATGVLEYVVDCDGTVGWINIAGV